MSPFNFSSIMPSTDANSIMSSNPTTTATATSVSTPATSVLASNASSASSPATSVLASNASSAPASASSLATSVLPSNASSAAFTSPQIVSTVTNISSGLPVTSPDLPYTTSSTSNIDLSSNNEQMLNAIQSLQTIERDQFSSLETNPNLTTDQLNQIINKINSISQMRINLYQTLGDSNTLYKNTLFNSQETLKEQAFAIGIVEKQLNEAKKQLYNMQIDKNNKIRLIEINDYYGEKYDEHTILMKYIIFMLVPIIIISFLFNKGLLPGFLFNILLFIIAVIGSIFIVGRLISIWSRDNMDYQKYIWAFNTKKAPVPNNKTVTDPWASTMSASIGTCIGSDCCAPGMTYDININQCVPAASSCSTSSSTAGSTLSGAYSFSSSLTPSMQESFINNELTKTSGSVKKADVTLDSFVMPSNY